MKEATNQRMTVSDINSEVGYKNGKKRSRRETCLIATLVIFVFISVGLFVALLVQIFVLPKKHEYCMSDDCTVAAATLIQSLDHSYDPCKDFYSFACGGYILRNPVPDDSIGTDVFEQHSLQILHQIRDLVENTDPTTVPLAVVKAQLAYFICMNSTHSDGHGGLEDLEKFLEGLGGWPLAVGPKWKPQNDSSVMYLMASLERTGFSMELVEVGISPDLKDPNTYRLTLDQPNSSTLRSKTVRRRRRKRETPSSNDDDEDEEEKARSQLIRNIAQLFGNNNITSINEDIEEMLRLEKDLLEISTPRDERRNYTRMYNKMTIRELNNYTRNKIEWLIIFQTIFNGVEEIDDSEPVIIAETAYMKKLPKLMGNYTQRTLTNYIIWELVHALVDQIDPHLSALYNDYMSTLDSMRQPKPRWKTCLEGTNEILGFALSRLFIDKHVDDGNKESADEFIRVLQRAYRDKIQHSDWLDDETTRIALHKVDTMKEFIGYPDWIMDDEKLNEYFHYVKLSNSHFINIVNDRIHSTLKYLRQFRNPVDRDRWTEDPTAVNAFYEGQTNSIWFPAAILKPPFFNMHRLAAMNFGAIGSIIGHEIGHGFDDEGGQFDENGVLRQWWSEEPLKVFVNKTQCFVHQYNDYCPEEYQGDDENATCIDGINTLGENIADNSGLKCAHKAYKYWIEEHGEEKRLPGLGQFSPEQIFFLSFAHIWCENNRRDQWKNIYSDDPHSPGRYRVIGSLSNFPEFAKSFNCPPGPMNRHHDSCSLWE